MAKRRNRLTPLERAYCRYNKAYFNNRLPRISEVRVRFRKIDVLGYQCGNEIAINVRFRGYSSIVLGTLLHEQVHLLLDDDESHAKQPHGKKFQKEMRRLARMGAFSEIW